MKKWQIDPKVKIIHNQKRNNILWLISVTTYNNGNMKALNHAIFGSLIAVTVSEPLIAIPLSLVSHFLMDIIPHYGEDPKAPRGSRPYYISIAADATLTILVLLLFLSFHPVHAQLLIVCAFVAISPDLLWPLALFIKKRGPIWETFKFHKNIQNESRSGIYVEIGWFIITTAIVISILK